MNAASNGFKSPNAASPTPIASTTSVPAKLKRMIPRARWNPQWRRDASPLLDELAASVDHVRADSKGGAHDLPLNAANAPGTYSLPIVFTLTAP
jgi:hypothetical protein